MKYSLGLTAATLIAIAGLSIVGCSEPSSQGLGLLDPYETSSPYEPGHGGSSTPSASPTASQELITVQDNLTNATFLTYPQVVAYKDGVIAQNDYFWALQYAPDSSDSSYLAMISVDAEKGYSASDNRSPHRIKLIDEDSGQELVLSNPTGFYAFNSPEAVEDGSKTFHSKSNPLYYYLLQDGGDPVKTDKVYSGYLVICDRSENASNGRIIIVNPVFTQEDTLYCSVICESARCPYNVIADGHYIWWTEYLANATVQRLEYIRDDNIRPSQVKNHLDKCQRTFVSGMVYPTKLSFGGPGISIADTDGGSVLVTPKVFGDNGCDEPRGGDIIPNYESLKGYQQINNNNSVWKFGNGTLDHPCDFAWLASGQMLVLEGGGNVRSSADQSHLGAVGAGALKIWEATDENERKSNPRLDEIITGLDRPMMLHTLYDASKDDTSNNAGTVDVMIPQYGPNGENMSSIIFCRFDSTHRNNHKAKKTSKMLENINKCSQVICGFSKVSPINDEYLPLPGASPYTLQFFFNTGIGDTGLNMSSIRRAGVKYPN